MATGTELTPTAYITHHLTFLAKPVGQGDFWTIHVDTVATAVMLGILGFGFLWSDLVCYSLGILTGALLEYRFRP